MKKNNASGQSAFAKTIRRLSYKYPTWQVWSDFITAFAIAISDCVDHPHRAEREAMYAKIMGKYTPSEVAVFPELAAEVINALESDPEQDFLGKVYMELELGNHWIGQFFTPYSVCECMAAISAGSALDQIHQKGYITLNDCACGAGATLIAGVHAIRHELIEKKSPLNWQNHVLVTAQDIDYTTGLMCYIQLSLLGCSGFVKIGDTFTSPMAPGDNKSNYWYTPMYFSDTWLYRRLFHGMDLLFQKAPPAEAASNSQNDSRRPAV